MFGNATEQAINVMTICKMATTDIVFTLQALVPHVKTYPTPYFEYCASLMVHPIMGKLR